MNPSTPNPEDHQWLDLLAGREVPDAPAACRVEASWLRAAMLTYREAAPAGELPCHEVRVRDLLAKAREAGLLSSEPTSSGPLGRLRIWWNGVLDRAPSPWVLSPAVAASVVAVVAAMIVFIQPSDKESDPSVLRGAPSVQVLLAEDPAAMRAKTSAQMRAAGLTVTEFERLGRLAIEVEVPGALTADQRAALGRAGFVEPQTPVITIEFVRPSGGR